MLSNLSDTRASLILRLRDAGDMAAWDEVVSVYRPLVFRMAQRQGLQMADAEDVVQEVFAAVARSIERWSAHPQRGRFRNWLLAITRNIAINVLTRRPFGAKGVGGDDAQKMLGQVAEHPLSSEFDIEYRREVYRWAASQVRQSVSQTSWDAFELTQVEGVPIAEVAAQLKMSVGSVYIARSRVMSRLREQAKSFEVSHE